jgi:predicted PurR-regulated permease PerM
VIASTVRWASIIACSFVTLSFLFFVVNQTSTASQNQTNAITGAASVHTDELTKLPNPPPAVEKVREKENDKFHEFVDDVDDVLLAPFTGISNSSSIWVRRLIPLGLALLIYGLGGLYLARALGLKRW